MVYPIKSTPATILAAVKAALRAGGYAWPGGYPQYILMSDGESLSIDSARENWAAICRSTIGNTRDGWKASGVDINWEDSEMVCAHSGEPIESAYGETETLPNHA